MPLLEVNNLSLAFGGVRALDSVNWQVEAGSISALIGPNGAGKTTLFNCVTGYLRPTRGSRIAYDGADVTTIPTHDRARRGLVRSFQHPRGFGGRSLRSNVEAVLHASGRDPGRADLYLAELDLLSLAGLTLSEAPYGVARRLNIAMALAAEPKLLMMDEPAAGLNDKETGLLSQIVFKLRDAGATIVLVEHNMRFVMSIVDCLTVLDAGTVLATGTPAEIGSNPAVIAVYLGEKAIAHA